LLTPQSAIIPYSLPMQKVRPVKQALCITDIKSHKKTAIPGKKERAALKKYI